LRKGLTLIKTIPSLSRLRLRLGDFIELIITT